MGLGPGISRFESFLASKWVYDAAVKRMSSVTHNSPFRFVLASFQSINNNNNNNNEDNNNININEDNNNNNNDDDINNNDNNNKWKKRLRDQTTTNCWMLFFCSAVRWGGQHKRSRRKRLMQEILTVSPRWLSYRVKIISQSSHYSQVMLSWYLWQVYHINLVSPGSVGLYVQLLDGYSDGLHTLGSSWGS